MVLNRPKLEIGFTKDHECEIIPGLYRYRVGDILKVSGFKNKAPQFSFVCRKNVALSIDSDKTDEVELQNAMKNAVTHLEPFDAHVSEYTSYADTTTIPGHYVLYWELNLKGSTPIPPCVYEVMHQHDSIILNEYLIN